MSEKGISKLLLVVFVVSLAMGFGSGVIFTTIFQGP